jgi:hypothetical protein
VAFGVWPFLIIERSLFFKLLSLIPKDNFFGSTNLQKIVKGINIFQYKLGAVPTGQIA